MVVSDGIHLEVLKESSYIVVEARDGHSHILLFPCKLAVEQVALPISIQVSRRK